MENFQDIKIDRIYNNDIEYQKISYMTLSGEIVTGTHSITHKSWTPKIRAVVKRLIKSQNQKNFMKANLI